MTRAADCRPFNLEVQFAEILLIRKYFEDKLWIQKLLLNSHYEHQEPRYD